MISVEIDVTVRYEELESAIEALADSLGEKALVEPLLRTGGVIRADSKRRFAQEGPGWKPLKESTLARKANKAEMGLVQDMGRGRFGKDRSIVQRVVRDAAAMDKFGGIAAALNDRIEASRARGRKTATMEARRDKALEQVRKRKEGIEAYRNIAERAGVGFSKLIDYSRREVLRAKRHGRILRAVKQLERAMGPLEASERRKMTRQHQRRFVASTKRSGMLGALYDSLGVAYIPEEGGGAVRAFSKAFIGKIHNEGGRAGHNAWVEKREFIKLEEKHLEFLKNLLEEQMIDGWNEAEE